jgi:hypothetical protein
MMSKNITSNNPFSRQCNIRSGSGPIYNKFCPPTNATNNTSSGRAKKEPCFGPYDNIVNFVWVVDLSNGNHLAYVDCDYVD